jgi:hypothetical protein
VVVFGKNEFSTCDTLSHAETNRCTLFNNQVPMLPLLAVPATPLDLTCSKTCERVTCRLGLHIQSGVLAPPFLSALGHDGHCVRLEGCPRQPKHLALAPDAFCDLVTDYLNHIRRKGDAAKRGVDAQTAFCGDCTLLVPPDTDACPHCFAAHVVWRDSSCVLSKSVAKWASVTTCACEHYAFRVTSCTGHLCPQVSQRR